MKTWRNCVNFCSSQLATALTTKGVDSVHRIDTEDARPTSLTVPPTGGLFYHLPNFELTYEFSPLDFTQVNLSVNQK